MNTSPDIAVVIVTWNSARWIGPCLDALAQTRYEGRLQVVVVDNASSDDSAAAAEKHPIACRVIRNDTNRGFGGANNIGWRAATSPPTSPAPSSSSISSTSPTSPNSIVLFLNADTEVRPDWLAPIAEAFASDPSIAIVGAKLLYPGGRVIQHAGGMIHPNGMASHFGVGQEDRGQYNSPREVDYVTGAALAARRSFLEETGGFDERFFPAYYEETDLCFQAHERGYKVVYQPRAVVIHHESVSAPRGSRFFISLMTRARVKFLRKHFSAADWLFGFLPFELRWFRHCESRGARLSAARSYLEAFRARE